MMRALALAGCGMLALAASGCESTEEQSARIGHEGSKLVAQKGLAAAHTTNASVRVSHVTLLQDAGRGAVALQLTANANSTQLDVPVLLSVLGSAGKTLYTNDVEGLEATLQQIPSLRPHERAWWVDDQVLTAQAGGRVQVHVGRGRARPRGSLADISTTQLHLAQQSGLSVLEGSLVNHSRSTAAKVPVFAVALRGGKVTAAGRALLAAVPSGSTPFQIFLVGDAAGSTIQVTVAPSPA